MDSVRNGQIRTASTVIRELRLAAVNRLAPLFNTSANPTGASSYAVTTIFASDA